MIEQDRIACKHGRKRTFNWSDFHEAPPWLAPSEKFFKFGISTLSEMAFRVYTFPFTTQLQGHAHFPFTGHKV